MTDPARPPRLFIPGPVEVESEIREEMCRPMIGHRAPEISELLAEVDTLLPRLFRAPHPGYVSTSSATAVMEAAVRNCVREKVLCCVNGAFSDRWLKICGANGVDADALEVEWGKPVSPEAVKEALGRGQYDAVTIVHCETSTGVLSPLRDIAEIVRQHDDVLLLVDAVTSLAVVPIETGAWELDVVLAGSQKGLGLPPGLTVYSVSPRALDRAAAQPHRGFYLDFVAMESSRQKQQTPFTPAVPQIYALRRRLEEIVKEPDTWFQERRARAELIRVWARDRFALFPEEGYESDSLTCIENTRGISVAALLQDLREHGVIISNGYGPLKEKTFRIGHMGANDVPAHRELLGWIDEFLARS